jgi:glycosyltransferase involved in cell wall biosynthesis
VSLSSKLRTAHYLGLRAVGGIRRSLGGGSARKWDLLAHVRQYPPASLAGAPTSLHRIMSGLVREGLRVAVISSDASDRSSEIDGVLVMSEDSLRGSLSDCYEAASVIGSQQGKCIEVGRRAAAVGRPFVFFVRGPGQIPSFFEPSLVVFNSCWLLAREGGRRNSCVVRPPVEIERYLVDASRGQDIVAVNLSQEKGGELVLELAKRMPTRRFLGVKGGYGAQVLPSRPIPNLSIMEEMRDVRVAYRLARIVLMPSMRESFGRVAVEAAISGIPVVSTPTDGVVEALGDSALYAPFGDVDAWESALLSLDSAQVHEERSQMVRERARRLAVSSEFEVRELACRIRGLSC